MTPRCLFAQSFVPAIFALCLAPAAMAQTTAAQLTGRILDSSGAVVVNAAITATNSATEVRHTTTSNELGNYTVPLLEPGTYSVKVESQGFRPIERPGVTLHVNQVARIDFTMEVGSVTESLSVIGEAPLLQASEASLGAVVDNTKIVNLPLNGRNPFDLVFLAPGALMYNRRDLPGNNIPLTNLSINGGPAMSNEVLLDGIPDTSPQYNQYAIIPSIDAVEEFKVQTNNMSAEFGRTSGGVINVSMKSGTNQLHGTAYEFLRNSALDASSWFSNATGRPKPPFRYNQFGATTGAPIRKDKTFFFGSYEGMRRRTGSTLLFSTLTAEQREGDFRQTRAQNGQVIQIFDPLTSRLLPNGGYQRDPFPSNSIPSNRVNPVSRKLLPYWPQPNLPGDRVTGINNVISNASEIYTIDQVTARIDHAFTAANRLFGRISWNSSLVTPPDIYGNLATPIYGPQLFTQRNAALNDTHAFTAHTFATFRVGFTRLRDSATPPGMGVDPTELGFPAYMRRGVIGFPSVQLAGYVPGLIPNVSLGSPSVINNISNAYTAQSDVTHIRGSHVLKAGLEYRLFRLHGNRPYFPSFSFNAGYTQGPDPTRGSPTAGHAAASFLLGTASGGSLENRPTQDTQTQYFAAFLQDDYRITPNLTLNFGLRFEQENLRTDRYNRLTFLDFDSPNPLKAPGVGPLRGGLQYVGVGGNPREQAKVARNFCPRFGFAWQWSTRRVVRGGYGIFIAPRTGWDFGSFAQTGFLAATSLVSSPDGITPTTFISDPYPNGFVEPTGSTLGLLTNVGAGLSGIDRNQKGIYVQQWNLGLQQTLAGGYLVEVAYAGSKGTHLYQALEYNQLPDRYLALGSELIRRIPNPFFGIIPATQPLGSAQISAGQLLRRYPQFNAFTATGSTSGSSSYHSLQVRAEKRLSRGFTYLVSYTAGKLIDDGAPGRNASFGPTPNFQNHNNRKLERSISSQEVSQRVSIAATYDLPFGRGNAPAPITRLISGWQINSIVSLQSGIPLSLTTSVNNTNSFGGGSRPNNNGRSAKLSGPTVERLNRYFDTSVFSLPSPFTFGNTSRTLPDVRAPGQVNFDLSLLKNTKITERTSLQFRAEAFNAFNNTNFGAPGQSIGSPAAGVISSAGAARILQFALKLYF